MPRGSISCIFILFIGQLMATESQVPTTSGTICENGMSICSIGSPMCIPDDKFCDNHIDCDDGMDEVGCWPPSTSRLSRPQPTYVDPYTGEARQVPSNTIPCIYGSFMCEDKNCIPLSEVCDGKRDCAGGRDETGCSNRITPRPPYIATDKYESKVTTPAYESTSEPPKVKISIYDSAQTVSTGNDVVFRCRDESALRVAVYWSRGANADDRALPANANDYNGRLTITKVTEENEGVYYCKANGYPNDRQTARLIITGGRHPGGSPSRASPDLTTPRSSSVSSSDDTRSSNTVSTTSQSPEQWSRLARLNRARKMMDCQLGFISCADGNRCIYRRQMCDGRVDCADGSDESACRKNCTNHRFTCGDQCLDKSRRCDGIVDCADATDEFLCHNECSISSYWCPNSQECIPQIYRCDGEFDCPDGADERQCERPRVLEQPQKQYTVEKGKSITLNCRASGIPKPTIEWRFNLQRIPAGASSSISVCTTCHNCSDNEVLSSLTLMTELIRSVFDDPIGMAPVSGIRPEHWIDADINEAPHCWNIEHFRPDQVYKTYDDNAGRLANTLGSRIEFDTKDD